MIHETVPAQLVAGDTWRLLRAFADYPAPTWTVTYYFENAEYQFSKAAVASGSSHALTVSAAESGAFAPGRYRYFARATDGSIVETVSGEDRWLEVLADPAAQGKRDLRSDARKLLDAVNATLERRATSDQLAMAINGRSLSRIPLIELRQWRTELRNEVRAEEQGSKAGLGRNIRVRFGRA